MPKGKRDFIEKLDVYSQNFLRIIFTKVFSQNDFLENSDSKNNSPADFECFIEKSNEKYYQNCNLLFLKHLLECN